ELLSRAHRVGGQRRNTAVEPGLVRRRRAVIHHLARSEMDGRPWPQSRHPYDRCAGAQWCDDLRCVDGLELADRQGCRLCGRAFAMKVDFLANGELVVFVEMPS